MKSPLKLTRVLALTLLLLLSTQGHSSEKISISEAFNQLDKDEQEQIVNDFNKSGIDLNEIDRDRTFLEIGETDGVHSIRVTQDGVASRKDHLFYIGIRVGFPFIAGVYSTYMRRDDGKNNFHVTVEASTLIFVHDTSISYGHHFEKLNDFYISGTVHRVILDDVFASSLESKLALSAGVGYMKTFGKNKNWHFNTSISMMAVRNDDSVGAIPSVKIGIGHYLGKRKLKKTKMFDHLINE